MRSEEINAVFALVKLTKLIPLNLEIPASVAIHKKPEPSSHCIPFNPLDGKPFSVV